jgi:hypothetical protein
MDARCQPYIGILELLNEIEKRVAKIDDLVMARVII